MVYRNFLSAICTRISSASSSAPSRTPGVRGSRAVWMLNRAEFIGVDGALTYSCHVLRCKRMLARERRRRVPGVAGRSAGRYTLSNAFPNSCRKYAWPVTVTTAPFPLPRAVISCHSHTGGLTLELLSSGVESFVLSSVNYERGFIRGLIEL